jgi:putative ABC transport system ATP-binding protein
VLRIETGSRVLLVGPSGSGKTTLLGLLAGVVQPTAGRLSVLGRDLTTMSSVARDAFRGAHVGYIFQLFNLIPYLKVFDNIVLPCRLSAPRRERLGSVPLRQAAIDVAEPLGIARLLQKGVLDLSVGQQQRVAAARALIGTPDLVIADEPTSSLDAEQRDRFLELLFASCAKAAATLIVVSHDPALRSGFDQVLSLPALNGAA